MNWQNGLKNGGIKMQGFLTTLFQCSISMTPITLAYMIMNPLLSKRYSAKWQYRIWLVIVIGWIFPYRPQFDLPLLPVQMPDNHIIQSQFISMQSTIGNTASPVTVGGEIVSTPVALSLWWVFAAIWIVGFSVIVVYHILQYRRFTKVIKRWSESVTDVKVIRIFDSLKSELKIKEQVTLKRCPGIKSPMLVGLVHPAILLPPIKIADNELSLILRHELIHCKRRDLWYKAMILIATALHWFNPVVYLMARATAVQCEIACDALVLQDANFQQRKQYGETIIGVIRDGTLPKTVLSTNFYGGKRGMKNRIVSILDTKRKKAGFTILCLVLIGIVTIGSALATNNKAGNNVSKKNFSSIAKVDDKYNKLLALRFEDYENMTVAEYRNKVWDIIGQDEAAYFELLNHIPESWEDIKQTDRDVYFILNVLTPIIAEKWETWNFGGNKVWDTGKIEYGASYTILDADTLTMGERNQAIEGINADISNFVEGKSKSELTDETAIQTLLEAESKKWVKKYSDPSLKVAFSFLSFRAEVINEQELENVSIPLKKAEENELENATSEDFTLFLSLKTKGYEKLSVADFNKEIVVTMEDDGKYPQKVFEKINNSLKSGTYPVTLTQQDLHFLSITLNASITENAVKHMQQYTDEVMRPYISNSINRELTTPISGGNTEMTTFQATIEYTLCYDILDENNLTVAERDRALMGLINGVRAFIYSKSEDELVGGKAALESKIDRLEKQYSNKQIQLSVENLIYQIHDERDVEALRHNN